jgi:hypothetical protein
MAAKDTPSMAKNKIRRSLAAILDPHPSAKEVDELWKYFKETCAYCGVLIDRKSRTGHIDHLVSSALGGSNDIHNHVLSCARCNGDEKREEAWQRFLSRKAHDPLVAKERTDRVLTWFSKAKPVSSNMNSTERAQAIVQSAIDAYDMAVAQMRALRKGGT